MFLMYFVCLVWPEPFRLGVLRNSSAVFVFLLYPLQIVLFWSFVGLSGQRFDTPPPRILVVVLHTVEMLVVV